MDGSFLEKPASRFVFQSFGETAGSAQGAPGRERGPQHAEDAARRGALLFQRVAADGAVRRRHGPEDPLLPESRHFPAGVASLV